MILVSERLNNQCQRKDLSGASYGSGHLEDDKPGIKLGPRQPIFINGVS